MDVATLSVPFHSRVSDMAPSSLPPLDKVDPVKAWQPWEPTKTDPWNLKWAGHLYRRAAFGGSPDELKAAIKKGHTATINLLYEGELRAAGFYKPDKGI